MTATVLLAAATISFLTATTIGTVIRQAQAPGISDPDTARQSEIPAYRNITLTRRAYDQDTA